MYGEEKLAYELALKLKKNNFDVEIAIMYKNKTNEEKNNYKRIKNKNIPITFLNYKPHMHFSKFIYNSFKIRKIISKKNYDIIETYGVTASSLLSISTLFTKAKLVVGLHHSYDSKFGYSKKKILWILLFHINKKVFFYGVSKYVSVSWAKYSHLNKKRITTIFNSIIFDHPSDQDFDLRKEIQVDSSTLILLYVGRLIENKGVENLILAFSQVQKTSNVILLLVGSYDMNQVNSHVFVDKINDMTKNMRQENKIFFLGKRTDVNKIMKQSTLLVHPSFSESFGLVVAEAFSAGLPVVSSNKGGLFEVLEHTEAQVIDPHSIEDITKKIYKALAFSPERIKKIIKKGEKKSREYHPNKRFKSILKFYDDIFKN